MKSLEKERFIGLEWLRFLLGCYVMIYHTSHRYPLVKDIPGLSELTSMGFFATSAFFVLSGFLLAHVYVRGNALREPATGFWAKRFFNLYPIHIVALVTSILVILLIQWLAIPPEGPPASIRFVIYDTNEVLGQTHPELFRHYMDNTQLAFNAVLQLFMLQAWNPYFLTFNAPLWSLSALFFFYILFPWLAPRLMNVKRIWLWLGIIMALYLIPPVFVVWSGEYGVPFTGLIQRFPLFRLPEFLGGILGYALFKRARQQGHVPGAGQKWALSLFILVCFLTATVLFTHGQKFWYFLLHNGLLLPAQIGLIYLSAMARHPQSKWLQRWSERLGGASLSMFALHVPLYNLFFTLEQFLRGNPGQCMNDWSGCIAAAGRIQPSLPAYVVYLLLTTVICVLFQEQFVVRVRKRLVARYLKPKTSPSVGSTAAE